MFSSRIIRCTKIAVKHTTLFQRKSCLSSALILPFFGVRCSPMVQIYHGLHTTITLSRTEKQFYGGGETETLFEFGQEIIQNIHRSKLTPDELDNQVNRLSGVLHQFFSDKDEDNLIKFFDLMLKKNLINEAAYTIMMRYYADMMNYEKVKYFFEELQSHFNIECHTRSFVPIIVVCLKLGNFEDARKYLDDMTLSMQMMYKDNVVQDILQVCTEILNKKNERLVRDIVDQIFSLLEHYGASKMKRKTIDAIVKWFESDKLQNWHIQSTSMGKKNGMCQYCKRRLKEADIPSERLSKLKRNLTTLVKASIVRKQSTKLSDLKQRTDKTVKNKIENKSKYFEIYDILTMDSKRSEDEKSSDRTSQHNKILNSIDDSASLSNDVFSKLNDLETFLNEQEQFDIVIDALNVGYHTSGFNHVHVKDTVQYFVEKGKKVLILCAGRLKEDFLINEAVAKSNDQIHQLMLFLDKHCSLFFVGSSVVDDYYILYTLIHHNFNIELVSSDMFRDHLFHLDAQNTADFQRWQRAHQYVIKAFTADGLPVYKARMNFNQAVQRHGLGWHVPVNDRAWLCISKKINSASS